MASADVVLAAVAVVDSRVAAEVSKADSVVLVAEGPAADVGLLAVVVAEDPAVVVVLAVADLEEDQAKC